MDWVRAESGIFLPRRPSKRERYGSAPIGIDLFCGCGGFSLGMIQGGFRVVGACDNDVDATMTYLMNLGDYPLAMHFVDPSDRARFETGLNKEFKRSHVVPVSGSHRPDGQPGVPHYWFGDIRKLTGAAILSDLGLERGDLDCVFGGPPCQGFSVQGKRNVVDPRNSLVFEFARLVVELLPKTLVMENVPGMLSMVTTAGTPVVDELCLILESGGFGVRDAIRNALLTTSGAGAAIKGKPRSKRPVEDEDDSPQLELLPEARTA